MGYKPHFYGISLAASENMLGVASISRFSGAMEEDFDASQGAVPASTEQGHLCELLNCWIHMDSL